MTPEELRNTLVLGAVEEIDEAGILLDPEERSAASRGAGAPLPSSPGRGAEERFLAQRAADLLQRLCQRFPESAAWLAPTVPAHPSRHPLLAGLLLFGAATLGYLTSELGPERRINILSLPLLGILAWSLLVYANEFRLLLTRRAPGLIVAALALLRRRPASTAAGGDARFALLAESRQLFEQRWARLSTPSDASRVKSLLHTAALVLAAAAVAGMYVKGLAHEYLAMWESTFLTESRHLLALLEIVLGPAVALSGTDLPTAAELDRIRGPEAGENAARWIHWYATTIALFVLLPRGVLALIWRLRAHREAASVPYRETSPRYYARLLATSSGSARTVAIAPYSVDPDETTKGISVRRLESEFEAAVEATWLPTTPFGDEEEPSLEFPPAVAEVVPLLSFGATPEAESHLAFFRTLSGRSPHPVRFALLDASAFDRKNLGLPDAAERRLARGEAWRRLFADEGVALLIQPEEPA